MAALVGAAFWELVAEAPEPLAVAEPEEAPLWLLVPLWVPEVAEVTVDVAAPEVALRDVTELSAVVAVPLLLSPPERMLETISLTEERMPLVSLGMRLLSPETTLERGLS
ncbi:hypothetical protein ACR8ET_22500 [Salmonella enterica subsp. enterica serovar Paratyphi A]